MTLAADGPVVIVGGGPIGLACALLLARSGVRSRVVEPRTLEEARIDPRLLALSAGSWQVLEPLLDAPALRRAPIREVFVSSAGEFGGAHLSSDEFGGADLGATTLYGDLLLALDAAVRRQGHIELLRPERMRALSQAPSAVRVELESGQTLEAPLAILAEGFGPQASQIFESVGTRTSGPSVAATSFAVLTDVRLQRPSHALRAAAYERFTREGPLALLPTPDRGIGGNESFALVWCCDEVNAARRCSIAAEALIDELDAAIGPRIGRVVGVSARHRMPLQQRLQERVIAHRVVALGNAAQALHPVAGQGFNLGLRDCVALADCLVGRHDPLAALNEYALSRRLDRTAIARLTQWLPQLFATRFAPLAVARAAALTAFGLSSTARRDLAHLLMFGIRA